MFKELKNQVAPKPNAVPRPDEDGYEICLICLGDGLNPPENSGYPKDSTFSEGGAFDMCPGCHGIGWTKRDKLTLEACNDVGIAFRAFVWAIEQAVLRDWYSLSKWWTRLLVRKELLSIRSLFRWWK